jgi:hypothetical protein
VIQTATRYPLRALGGFIAVLALGCAGCSTTLERMPRPAVDLSGHWILDPAASDDAAKRIDAILPKSKRRPDWERTAPVTLPADNPQSTRGGGQSSRGGQRQADSTAQAPVTPPSWARLGARDFVNAFALPPTLLNVIQTPSLMVLDQAGRRRSFEPGDDTPHSINDRFGSRTVLSGWAGGEFVVDSRNGARLIVKERLRLVAPDRLALVVSFSAERLQGLTIRSVYRRASEEELAAPPPEGPPAPGPR